MRRDELLNWMPSIEAEFDRRGLDTYAMAVSRATEMLQRDGETIKKLRAALTRIAVGVPAIIDGEFAEEHHDESGEYAGIERFDPIVVVSSIVGVSIAALRETNDEPG